MFAIAENVEDAAITVLAAEAGMESVEVIHRQDVPTHTTFPRVIVECSGITPLITGQADPYSGILELTVQTESSVDTDGQDCRDIADIVYGVLLPPDGVSTINAAASGVQLYKLELTGSGKVEEEEDSGIMETEFIARLYMS